eukprot:NODE_5181_length_709_cov_30.969697_g4813_i0.p1 GENE.NODE_5181_length_709_cov_30.969697_g4813_i0~~NODE_5181_length_709_cov_30.969697_g4813_i0.p1  ORF type:complete len:166 (+),score=31.11 NODE_5181_length_709_cov_30.969697_g4813_i0:35-532(+)
MRCALRLPKTEVRTDSTAGRGLYATAPIAAGETVAIKAGYLFSEAELVASGTLTWCLQVEDGLFMGPRKPEDVDEGSTFINHSCDPNLGFKGQMFYVAMRDIAAGEELTHDYAIAFTSGMKEFDCRCGSKLCRGRWSHDDWKKPEIQARYNGWFQPYLAEKIKTL